MAKRPGTTKRAPVRAARYATGHSNLFDLPRTDRPPDGWVPHEPPDLQGETEMRLDFETTGLKWWDQDRVVGAAYLLKKSGRRGYIAWGHKGGGNIDEGRAKAWLHALRGMHIENANTRFDIHIGRASDIDLVKQGNSFGDVQHRAALLDDHRFRLNIDQLAKDFLGEDMGKVDLELANKGDLWRLPAWEVEPYAIRDVEIVDELIDRFQPMLEEQELLPTLRLESDVIPVVCEMEKNGALLDVETLFRWQALATEQMEQEKWEIHKATGVWLTSPDKNAELQRLFVACGIPFTAFTGTLDKHGMPKPSFTGEVLKAVDHPIIKRLLKVAQLADLKSKYLDKYAKDVRQSDGWMRFNLHQLRIGRDEDDKHGTISGRFSSAGDDNGGFNIQQVVSPDKQKRNKWCEEFIIRNLFKPMKGAKWLAADADQIEYRIFAHFSNSKAILDRYNALPPYEMVDIDGEPFCISGPNADYHAIAQLMFRTVMPDIKRKPTKITNFCKLFGAALPKFALTLGTINQQQFEDINKKYPPNCTFEHRQGMFDEPILQSALRITEAYEKAIPEGKKMMDLAKRLAKERGWVKTEGGRRARFPGGQRAHSALNRAVQGTAADINKRVMVEVYNHREELCLTPITTVHDEFDGHFHSDDPKILARVKECFNTQYVKLKVPILWGVSTGPSWGEAKGKA